MNSTVQAITAALDRAVDWTGVPRLIAHHDAQPARPFRFLPVALLAMTLAGLAVQWHGNPYGYAIVSGGWTLSMIAQGFGPLRPPGNGTARDEREVELARRGALAGATIAAASAWLGCMAAALAEPLAALGWLQVRPPVRPLEWVALAMTLQAIKANATMLAASWLMPREPLQDE